MLHESWGNHWILDTTVIDLTPSIITLIQALRQVNIPDMDINLLVKGADYLSTIKSYILRHINIFLKGTKLIDII